MPNDLRWAARYQFLEELWRSQPRVVVDPDVEHVLAAGGPGFAHGSHPPLAELADDLLPRGAGGPPAWCAVSEVQTEALQRSRPGTRFVSVDAVVEVLQHQSWEVALVDLRPFLSTDDTDDRIDRDRGEVEAQLGPDGPGLVDALAAGIELMRTVVLSVPIRDYPRSARGLTYEELADLVGRLGGGRIYALFDSPMAGVVEYGEPVEPPFEDETALGEDGIFDDDDDGEDEPDEDDDAPLTFDNTLALAEPWVASFLAVVGAPGVLAEGLTLLELPPAEEEGRSEAANRGELQEVRRQADLVAIQRQQLLETVSALRHDNAVLLDELDGARRVGMEQVPAVIPPPVGEGAPVRPDEEVAREQELQWRVAALEGEAKRLRERPVTELEAEVATLRAQLAQADRPGNLATPKPRPPPADDPEDASDDRPQLPAPPDPRGLNRVVRELERLLVRVERDPNLQAVEVRGALVQIRARLREF